MASLRQGEWSQTFHVIGAPVFVAPNFLFSWQAQDLAVHIFDMGSLLWTYDCNGCELSGPSLTNCRFFSDHRHHHQHHHQHHHHHHHHLVLVAVVFIIIIIFFFFFNFIFIFIFIIISIIIIIIIIIIMMIIIIITRVAIMVITSLTANKSVFVEVSCDSICFLRPIDYRCITWKLR